MLGVKPSEVVSIISFLGSLGINVEQDGTTSDMSHLVLRVNRDSMVNAFSKLGEEEAYAETIKRLKERFNKRFHWFMKNDDDLFLDVIVSEKASRQERIIRRTQRGRL